MNYLEAIRQKRLEKLSKTEQERSEQRHLDAVISGSKAIERTVITQSSRTRNSSQPVEVKNIDGVASSDDIGLLAKTVDDLLISTSVDAMESTEKLEEICDNLEVIAGSLDELPREYDQTAVIKELRGVITSLSKLPTSYPKPEKLGPLVERLIKTIDGKDYSPTIEVKAPEVIVPSIDLSGVEKQIGSLKKALPKTPDVKIDLKPLEKAIKGVKDAVDSQQFPIPNYVLPFKDQDGKAVQAPLDSSGNLKVSDQGSSPQKTLIDKTSTTNVIYIGKAPIGTATSAGAWLISKVDKSGSPISITYADAGASTAVWNDRVSEVYT